MNLSRIQIRNGYVFGRTVGHIERLFSVWLKGVFVFVERGCIAEGREWSKGKGKEWEGRLQGAEL